LPLKIVDVDFNFLPFVSLKTIILFSSCIMVEAKAQAAQLDSVTDVVQEQEVDATRALQAMNAFLSDGSSSSSNNANNVGASSTETTLSNNLQQKLMISSNATTAVIRAEDVQLICHELDVTEDAATKALRDAANEAGDTLATDDKDALVTLALRKLITS
jgi:sensor c-di-GMP phosphodiesterase-like protein